jgi:hypothetical protein
MPATTQPIKSTNAIATAQLHVGEVVPNSNWCAYFVSDVYKEAGLSSLFAATGYVPTLVSEFSGKTSKNITTAQPGDLIVFGNNEHVMMFEGGSTVIGTATDASGITRVVETNMNNVTTDSGAKGPSLVLHANLDGTLPAEKTLYDFIKISDPADLGQPTAGANNYFSGVAAWLKPNAPHVSSYADAVSAKDSSGIPIWDPEELAFLKQVDSKTPINQLQVPDSLATAMASNLHLSGFQNLWGGQDTSQGQGVNVPGLGDITSIANILGKFTNPANWLHAGAMVAGVGLIGFGAYAILRDVGTDSTTSAAPSMPVIIKEGA